MKKNFTLVLGMMLSVFLSFAQDNPATPSNFQSMPSGSYIIAMDHVWQLDDNSKVADRMFNLKSYGLVTHLLNNKVKVKRVIAKGKAKDASDFTVSAAQVKPSAGVTSMKSFAAGPFVVFAADAAGLPALIDAYNNSVTDATRKVKVYQTSAAVTVDVRYDYNGAFKPRAAILDIGANPDIHEFYFTSAGITTANYSITTNTNSLIADCFTFASSPHADNVPAMDINNVKSFVEAGGNFLAQCKATESYEEGAHFHTVNGTLTVLNKDAATTEFPHPDVNYAQFQGPFEMAQGGAVQTWKYNGALKSSTYITATGLDKDGNQAIGASASKQTAANKLGGVVFYLGNHRYSDLGDIDEVNGMRQYLNAFLTPASRPTYMTAAAVFNQNGELELGVTGGPSTGYPVEFKVYRDNGTTGGAVDAGDQLILTTTITQQSPVGTKKFSFPNASGTFIIEVNASIGCANQYLIVDRIVLPISLKSFDAKRNRSNVDLAWETASEESNTGFNIQRLLASGSWENVGFVPSRAVNGTSATPLRYTYTDPNGFRGVSQYRLQEVEQTGRTKLSDIRSVMGESQASSMLIYPNPTSTGKVNLVFSEVSARDIIVFDITGRMVKEFRNLTGNNVSIDNLKTGVYSVQVADRATGTVSAEKIVVK